MFKLEDGREELTQWDLDRRVIVSDKAVTEVHFCNRTDKCSLCTEVYEDNGARVADIPNILLQSDLPIKVYAYDGCYTKHMTTYKVNKRTQPTDYAYSETQIVTWQSIRNDVDAALAEVDTVYEDIDALKADVDELKNAPTVITPDLAQNDDSAPDYVKNRTHYIDGTEEVYILPEITVPSNTQIPLEQPFDIKANETYICVADGVEYECTAIEIGAALGVPFSVVGIGNAKELTGTDTGEPFYFVTSANEIAPGAYGMARIDNDKDTATVSLKQAKEKVHKLDNKYLDLDWLPIYKENPIAAFACTTNNDISSGGSVVDGMRVFGTGVSQTVLTNLNYNKAATLDNQTAPAAIVTIVLDGVSYNAYCVHFDYMYLIRFDTNMQLLPFIICNNLVNKELQFGAGVDGDHTVIISAKEPNKIPEDFLPGETKPATTIVYLDGHTVRLNEKCNLVIESVRNEILNGIANKNLILTKVTVYDGNQLIDTIDDLVMSNYYSNSTTAYASATFSDVYNNNAYVLNIAVDRDGAYTYINAHRISYDTWNGGSY